MDQIATVAIFLATSLVAVQCDWSSSSAAGAHAMDAHRSCEPVSIAMCRGVGYNETAMPNQFHHDTQDEAGLIVHQFWPLVEISCSPYLRFFLCSMYVPICLRDYGRPLPPCRSVCEHARRGCEPLMRNYGFKWPDDLDCGRLPESGKDKPENLCMEPPAISAHSTTSSTSAPTTSTAAPPKTAGRQRVPPAKTPGGRGSVFAPEQEDGRSVWQQLEENVFGEAGLPAVFDHKTLISCRCQCQSPFVIAPERPHSRVARNLTHCAHPCASPYIEPDRMHLVKVLLTLWAVCCFAASLATCLTFLIDMDRFHYPERPIFCLTFCYMLVSAGYLLRFMAGHSSVACNANTARSGASQVDLCLAVFVLTYYFGMASAVWWVILSLTWFLAAGLKWSHEAIASYWPYFHLFAWLLPLAQTGLALGLKAVDGDGATGLCGVGNTDVDMLRVLELGPLVAYVVLGSAFLAAGFISLVRIRHIVKAQTQHHQRLMQQHKQPLCTPYHQQMTPADACPSPVGRLEQLMLKLGGFALLYALPTAVRIVALFYEQHYRTSWEISMVCHCSVPGMNAHFPMGHSALSPTGSAAPLLVALSKHGSSLAVGIAGCLWVASGKTLRSWAAFVCCDRRTANREAHAAGGYVQAKRRPDSSNSRYATARYEPAEAIIIKSHTDVSSAPPATGAQSHTPNMANGGGYQHLVPQSHVPPPAAMHMAGRLPQQQHMVYTPSHQFVNGGNHL